MIKLVDTTPSTKTQKPTRATALANCFAHYEEATQAKKNAMYDVIGIMSYHKDAMYESGVIDASQKAILDSYKALELLLDDSQPFDYNRVTLDMLEHCAALLVQSIDTNKDRFFFVLGWLDTQARLQDQEASQQEASQQEAYVIRHTSHRAR